MLQAFCLVAVCSIPSRAQIINTVVGSGTSGHTGDGGAATSATLNTPAGIGFNSSGSMFVTEYNGNYIREINTSGTISTYAGTGSASSTGDGFAASLATLKNPAGIAYDASGNMYVAEAGGNRIRKITTAGIISTIAGTGAASSTGDGSAATSATLNSPTDLAFDASGDLYISESGGNRIRKITTSTGNISTFAGTGTASSTGDGGAANAATVNSPAGILFDGSGNLYIAENGGNRIRKINTSGNISTVAGNGTASSTGDGSAATSATVKGPRSLAMDASGNLFISEESGSIIRKINFTSGNISTIAGTGTFGYSGDGDDATSATFKTPYSITFHNGNLYIVDLSSYVVRRVCNAPVPTVAPVTYCQNETASELVATGTNLLWYSSESDATGSTTAPTPITTSTGTTSYFVSQTPTTYGCESPKTEIVVTVNRTPAAPTVTSSIPYCEGSTATALTATKAMATDVLTWYTAATGGTGAATAPTPSTSVVGTEHFYVSSKSDLNCESPRSDISVTVNDTPSAPSVVTPVTYCQGATAVELEATLPSSTDELYWYTTATGGTGVTAAPVPSTTTAGTFPHYVSAKSVLGCEGARSLINVVINPTPAAPAVTTPINYCEGESPVALTATKADASYVLTWYTDASGGTGSTTAITPSTATSGTINYYVSAKTTLDCEGSRAAIAVNTNPIPAAPTVPSVVNLCKDAVAAPLTATAPASTDILKWYTSAIGGTGSTTAITPSTASVGTTLYYVSAKSAEGCEGERAAITVVVNALPATPTVTSPVNFCLDATSSILSATAPSSTDTLIWYTVATGGTGALTAPTPSTAAVGSTPYYVSVKNNLGCEGSRATITSTINPPASTPTVVTPLGYCEGASASALTATKASGTDVLQWYNVATGGTASTTAPTPATTTSGTESFYVSAKTSFGCEGTRATIVVNTNPLPAAPTFTSPIEYCQTIPATALTATTADATDTLKWYTSAIGGTASATAPTPSTATAGTTLYYVSSKSSHGCEGDRYAITVNVNPAPDAPTVTTPVKYCAGETATPLSAVGTDLLWYTAPTGGTGSTSAITPSTTTVGTTTYYVTQSPVSGACESPRTPIVVTINPIPDVPVVTSPIQLCDGATASALTATKASATDTLYWYNTLTGGTGSITAPVPSTAGAGTADYFVSIKTIHGCEGARDTITVNVNANPLAPTISSTPLVYCQYTTATDLSATGTNLKWYTAATGGTGSATAINPSTASAGTTKYYVSQSLAASSGGCESPRTEMSVLVNAAPALPVITTPLNLCKDGPGATLTATGSDLKWYDVATGGTALAAAPTHTTASTGTTSYYVTQTSAPADGSCESQRAELVVRVRALPAAPTVTTPVNLCEGGTGTTLTASGSNLKWYTASTGGTASTTAPAITTGTSTSYTYYVSASLSAASGGCEGARTEIKAVVNPLPSTPTVVTPLNLCFKETASALTATGSNLLWYTTATGGTGSTTAPTPSTATVANTTYYVSQTSAASVGSCEGNRTPLEVKVQPLPVVSISSLSPSGLIFCAGKTVTLKAISGTAASYQWSALGTPVTGATTDTYNAGTTGITGVEVKDIYGCKGVAEVYTQQDTSKKPTLSPTVTTICVEGSALLTCNPGFTSYTFDWLHDGVSITPATPKSNTKLVNEKGTYAVVVTNNFGCVDTTNTAVINHYPRPVKPVITNAEPKLSIAKTYRYFQWYHNGAPVAGANNYVFNISLKGSYYVEVTDENGCTNVSDTVFIEKNVGISNTPARTAMKLYPNPTQNKINIDAPIKINVRVIDIVGKVVFEGNDVQTVDLENQPDGTYFFRISDENNQLISVEKITKASR